MGTRFMCTVQNRLGGHKHIAESNSARRAVFDALQYAANRNMSGIDLGMDRVYEHPVKVNENAP